MAAPATALMTAEEFADLGDIGPCELIEGRLVKLSGAKPLHGQIAMRLGYLITDFVSKRNLGRVYGAGTGFLLARDPDTVRCADVAFVTAARAGGHDEDEYFGFPDLAVEVLSPSDRVGEVADKVQTWLAAGTRSVWVVDPTRKLISIYRDDGSEDHIRHDAELRDELVLPGFVVSPADVIFQA
jgi:Uma2 family endonuclease